jgi:hypothetical protein
MSLRASVVDFVCFMYFVVSRSSDFGPRISDFPLAPDRKSDMFHAPVFQVTGRSGPETKVTALK